MIRRINKLATLKSSSVSTRVLEDHRTINHLTVTEFSKIEFKCRGFSFLITRREICFDFL